MLARIPGSHFEDVPLLSKKDWQNQTKLYKIHWSMFSNYTKKEHKFQSTQTQTQISEKQKSSTWSVTDSSHASLDCWALWTTLPVLRSLVSTHLQERIDGDVGVSSPVTNRKVFESCAIYFSTQCMKKWCFSFLFFGGVPGLDTASRNFVGLIHSSFPQIKAFWKTVVRWQENTATWWSIGSRSSQHIDPPPAVEKLGSTGSQAHEHLAVNRASTSFWYIHIVH